MKNTILLVSSLAIALLTTPLFADDFPDVTTDGLPRVKDSKVAAAYLRPGADLGEYDKIALLEAYVAFRKDWQRDYNREAMRAGGRISDKEIIEIRDALAEEFAKVFTEELSNRGGHQMVSEGDNGVLIIRPAIVNLDITAPDTMSAGRSRTFTTSAGQMTLYMELYDGLTGEIIAKIIDPKAIDDRSIHYSNRVTNKADADRILRRWAQLLNDHLAEVKAANKTGK